MRFSVAIQCLEQAGGGPGWVNADNPVRMSDPVAFLDVDLGARSYNATTNAGSFRSVIGPSFGEARGDLSILGINMGVDLVLSNLGQPVLVLNSFLVHPLLRNYGAAFWKYDSRMNRWNAWTYYRSILHPATMTPDQRTEAMLQIVSDDLFWKDLGSQVADFIDPKSLAMMAGIMALCASNPIGWFAAVLAVVLGASGIAIDWMKLAPEWQKFQAYRNYSKDENDLREGAKSIAIILTTVIMEFATMKVMDAVGHRLPLEKLREVFFKKTRADWERAGNQVKAANNGADPPIKPPVEPEPTVVKSPGREPWTLPEDQTFQEPIKRYLREMQEAKAKGDDLTALEKYIDAEKSYTQYRVMRGHAKGVEVTVNCESQVLLPKIRELMRSTPYGAQGVIIKWFADNLKVKLDPAEATALTKLATKVKDAIQVKGHDFFGAGHKGLAQINEGMKSKLPAVPPALRERLRAAMANLGSEPTEVTDQKVWDVLNTKDPSGKFICPEKIRNWWNQRNYEAMDRSIAAGWSIEQHNVQPHHTKVSAIDLLDKDPVTLIEQGADIFKSKIELERGYGKTIGLNDDIPFFPGDGPEIRASAKLAQAAIRYLVNSGQYRPEQFTKASTMCDLQPRDIWRYARAGH
jgi:hypothetical protein